MRNTEYNKYDIFLFLLISTIPIAGFWGTFSASKILTIFFFPSLLVKIQCCDYSIKVTRLIVILFLLYCLISLGWTPNPEVGIKELVYFFLNFSLFLEILVFSRYANKTIKVITWAWITSLWITIPIAAWEILTDNHLTISKEDDGAMMENMGGVIMQRYSATVTFFNVNGYSTFLCFCIPFVFTEILRENKGVMTTTFIILSGILLSIIILINSSRGALVVLLISLFVLFFISKKTKLNIFMMGVFLSVIVYLLYRYYDFILGVIIARSADGGLTDNSAREIIWSNAINVLYDYNGLGCGVGGLKTAMAVHARGGVCITHSLFFEILAGYGILWAILFSWWIYRSLIKSLKFKDINRKQCLLFIILALPFSTIINSGYLLEPMVYALFASMYVLVNYEHIKFLHKSLRITA